MSFIDSEQSAWMADRDLRENGMAGLLFYSYKDLGHWFNEKELEDLARWISILIPNKVEVPTEVVS